MSIDQTIAALPGKSDADREKIRANAERLMVSGNAGQKANAQTMLAALDDLIEYEHQQLVAKLGGMTVAQRIAEAFEKVPPTETEAKVIQALMDHPDSTSTQLSQALGWGAQTWHMHFGNMCATREIYLWPAPKSELRKDAKTMTMILADLDTDGNTWRMKPEAAKVFIAMGLG